MQITFLILLGLVVGSFLTALLHRLHTGASMTTDRSRCVSCDHVLSWKELIPLVSFIVQRGRCRHCNNLISWQYPAIILGTAAFFATLSMYVGECNSIACGASLSLLLFWGVLLISISIFDFRWMLIPDELIIAGFVVALSTAFFWMAPNNWHSFSFEGFSSRLGGFLIAGGFLLMFFVLSRGRAMGFGDVKLAGLLGFLVGWQSSIGLLILAFVVGGFVGGLLLLTGRAGRGSKIPFGPYLAVSGFVMMIWGDKIIKWYLSFALLL